VRVASVLRSGPKSFASPTAVGGLDSSLRVRGSALLRPPTGDPPLGDGDAHVLVMTRLGGLLRQYSRAAA